ncbi:hypothetical protein EWM64_g3752 [Hericium alpestre]|uniref:Uncharacterized protein n=1 Tax=Hericium alpestre TaxID=135208 RepID=A0A4Y9ZZE2_9AGAM|nr:hypothetical protein EWM64_g3752 [Hericium alpestre]
MHLSARHDRSASFQAIEYDNRFFVNPGSATGAWTGTFNGDPTPSFALMDIQGPVVVTYVYQLIEGEVRVEKIEYRKDADAFTNKDPSGPRSAALPQSISTGGGSQQGVW